MNQAMSVTQHKLERDNSRVFTSTVSELLNLCLTNTYFVSDGQSYKQKHGAAMGYPGRV